MFSSNTSSIFSTIRPAITLFFILTLITGVVYPASVTFIGRFAFPHQANGSLIQKEDRIVGSELIGQAFDEPRYFWSRPSATSPHAYNASASSGSNQGPTNPALIQAVTSRVQALRTADPTNTQPIPIDLVTASGSGLDPHISIAAAMYQVPRIARTRFLQEDDIKNIIAQYTENRTLGILGEARANVLRLNLALDAFDAKMHSSHSTQIKTN